MRVLIMANGEYGSLPRLKPLLAGAQLIICADGGANYARRMGLKPDFIVGDMDSIRPEVKAFYERQGVAMRLHPPRKDATDLQLALELALQQRASDIMIVGALGGRLDFSFSNLLAGLPVLEHGAAVCYISAALRVYLCRDKLLLNGTPGDTVSLLPLTPQAAGVGLRGFEYPLRDAVLTQYDPFAVSNVMLQEMGEVSVSQGVLAVFHYPLT
ncbi:MAG: thiamine diphosphokinase [Syntrophomonadaceae bacterium]|nr:thiamine diphosphokinase [Syntrophomonadaceae bacterium]